MKKIWGAIVNALVAIDQFIVKSFQWLRERIKYVLATIALLVGGAGAGMTAQGLGRTFPGQIDRLIAPAGQTVVQATNANNLELNFDNAQVGRGAANNVEFDLAGGFIDLDAATGIVIDSPYAEFQADGSWLGTGTDASWYFSSAADAISTTAQTVRIQPITDTTATPALDIDKGYSIGAGTANVVDIDILHDPTADRSAAGLTLGISTNSGNANVPVSVSGGQFQATVAADSAASYLWPVVAVAQSYGDQSGGLSNVVEAVWAQTIVNGTITGHAFGMANDLIANGDTKPGYEPGNGADINEARAYDGTMAFDYNAQIDNARGYFIQTYIENSADVTALVGVDIELDTLEAGTTLGTNYGIAIRTPASAGTLTTNHGLHIESQSVGTNNYAIHSTGATFLNQDNATGARPVLELDQDDIDESFIDYIGTSAADATRSISTMNGDGAVDGPLNANAANGWTFEGMIRIEINGVEYWMPFYSLDTP